MITLMRSIPLALLLLVGCAPKVDEFVSPDITSQELRRHIKYLASDELKGRMSGEEGNRLAADYIASQFKRDGLLSPPEHATPRGGYLQEFSFVTSRKL